MNGGRSASRFFEGGAALIFSPAGCGFGKRALPLPAPGVGGLTPNGASALVDGSTSIGGLEPGDAGAPVDSRATADASLPATDPGVDQVRPCDVELRAPRAIEGADGTFQSLPFDWGNVFSWDDNLLAHENTLWCRE